MNWVQIPVEGEFQLTFPIPNNPAFEEIKTLCQTCQLYHCSVRMDETGSMAGIKFDSEPKTLWCKNTVEDKKALQDALHEQTQTIFMHKIRSQHPQLYRQVLNLPEPILALSNYYIDNRRVVKDWAQKLWAIRTKGLFIPSKALQEQHKDQQALLQEQPSLTRSKQARSQQFYPCPLCGQILMECSANQCPLQDHLLSTCVQLGAQRDSTIALLRLTLSRFLNSCSLDLHLTSIMQHNLEFLLQEEPAFRTEPSVCVLDSPSYMVTAPRSNPSSIPSSSSSFSASSSSRCSSSSCLSRTIGQNQSLVKMQQSLLLDQCWEASMPLISTTGTVAQSFLDLVEPLTMLQKQSLICKLQEIIACRAMDQIRKFAQRTGAFRGTSLEAV